MATDVDIDGDVAEIGSNMAFDRKFEEIIQSLAVEVKWDISIDQAWPKWVYRTSPHHERNGRGAPDQIISPRAS
ncbi:hypothetical protein HF325_001477 [Metschnikowia pulcherrima]|uniref:Uncharacterized protein n=1 Tax=Metschnikowia pulcherrima TaxID=27326 RepID=A0A8H7GUN9_9ASCO|nr:hypothetical protein HF325_001477 [Metschnikowia pulcherrima]